jgi:hypothetical protein
LKLPPEDWPSGESQPDKDVVMQERRKTVLSSLLCKDVKADWYYSSSDNYDKVVRVLAWVLCVVGKGQLSGLRTVRTFQGHLLGLELSRCSCRSCFLIVLYQTSSSRWVWGSSEFCFRMLDRIS